MSSQGARGAGPGCPKRLVWAGPVAVFVTLTLLLFGPLLVQSRMVLGLEACDILSIFLPLREFGFGQLAQGNVALWNPYMYGGVPHLAGFQSALFYPPNWLHLLLSPAAAINWNYAAHVFAAGY